MKNLLIILAFTINFSAFGQLADGSIAPNFTLTDFYGTTHTLYNYLDSGKTVFVEIFAAHCPSCWSYHQTHRLKNMYNLYGPAGTDEIMVLALEHDANNDSNAFMGIGDPWFTAGNWLDGTPYPIFNVEWPDRGVFTDYNVTFYPVIYKICSNKVVERVNTSTTEAQLYQKVQACQALSITEEGEIGNIYYDQRSRSIIVDQYKEIKSLYIINLRGVILKTIHVFPSEEINVDGLAAGVYLFEFKTASGSIIEKLSIF